MKPVTVRGFFDHEAERKIPKLKNGEKGVEVVTPFYTHVGSNEKP